MSKYLDTALAAIRRAEEITLRNYNRPARFTLKVDGTPVTAADKGAERVIRKVIAATFPEHRFFGEEYGRTGRDNEYCWLIDPIDGTKNYIDRIPLWGTLIALTKADVPILGVSSMPLMNELLWAEKGNGAFLNGQRVRVSNVRRLNECMISYGSLSAFSSRRKLTSMLKLISMCGRQRSFGDLWPYHLLASGRIDIVTEAAIKPVDVAPFVVICDEAGGSTSDLHGRPFSLDIQSFLATNGKLHDQVLGRLRI